MILATHVIIGAGLASFFPNNFVMAFAVSFASHFALDIIPHWDYELLSQTKNKENRLEEDIKIGKNFFLDLAKIILDVAIGSVLAVLFFHSWLGASWLLVLIGVAGGVLPDALQFAYFKIRREPLRVLQKFHLKVHSGNESLKEKFPKAGIFLQILFNAFFILLVFLQT